MEEDIEYWKDIKGFEGLYQISTKKNVRRFFLKSGFTTVKASDGYITLSDSRNDILEMGKVDGYYDTTLGGRGMNMLCDNIRRAIPIVAFDMNGNFIGRYGTLNSFIKANYDKDSKFSSDQLRNLRDSVAKYKEHYVMTCDDKPLKELQDFRYKLISEKRKTERTLKEGIRTQETLKLLSKVNRAIIITDNKYVPIETYNDTLTSLAKREKTPEGTMKARMNRDLKVFKKYISDKLSNHTLSEKHYFYMPKYFEVIRNIEDNLDN